MKRKPKIGETLYSLNVGNKAGRGREQKLTPMTVYSVGRKYFTLKRVDWNIFTEFHLDTWRQKTEFCEDHKLYETEQEWVDEKEENTICGFINLRFEYGKNTFKIPLEDLRKINEIITKYVNNP
jgi:hypothetical protein